MRSTSNVRKKTESKEKAKEEHAERKIAGDVNKSCSLVNMEKGLVVVIVLGHVMMEISYIR